MKGLRGPRTASNSLLALAVLGACLVLPVVEAQEPRKTVWDGVYTGAQADRGQELYKKECGHCHRDNLTGGGSEAGAPALAGPIFTVRWRDQPLAEMFLTIGTTMPKNKPDSLTPAIVADIVSFLLKANEMPVGREELPPDLEKLKQILLTEKR